MEQNSEKNDNFLKDCLIADFQSIKNEIGRRSNLQKATILTYLTGVGFIISNFIFTNQPNYILLCINWIMSYLAIIFILKEGMEIKKLSEIIKQLIIPQFNNNSNKILFPSEQLGKKFCDISSSERSEISKHFIYIIFFAVPLFLSIYYFYTHFNNIKILEIILIIFLTITTLLKINKIVI